MKVRKLGVIGALALMSCATPAATPPPTDSLAAITSSRLERFASEAEFLAYVRELRQVARARGEGWAQTYKQAPIYQYSVLPPPSQTPPPPPPPPSVSVPSPSPPGDSAVVTGTSNQAVIVDSVTSSDLGAFPDTSVAEALQRVPGLDGEFSAEGAAESITNVQTRGVDEGDIVKRVGHFLIVLQDGRLFTVDMRVAGEPGLAFVDRINVYRRPDSDTWYDEMLVYRNRILVTGYSYAQSATEISVFSLSEDGHVAREAVYYMSSNDYYDIENYATRLVDDKLVVYTPLDLTLVNPDQPVAWPVVRRWVRGEGERAVMGKAERLFEARDIYRPIQPTLHPVVHSISTCDLGSTSAGDELACTATAFTGPADHEFFIATDGAYLWTSGESEGGGDPCAPAAARFESGSPSTLFRAPFSGEDGAMRVRGQPRDQLGLSSTETDFRALLVWSAGQCANTSADRITLKYFSAPLSDFAAAPGPANAARYTDVPSLDAGMLEERFTDTHLIYGARRDWYSYPPNAPNVTARVVAVPLAAPANATVIEAPHNILRVERVGTGAVLTGYRNDDGLSVSLVDLSSAPRIASTIVLARRYESEGRSHAFNSRVDDENEGVMGLPTVPGEEQSGRWWWRSGASDVSFITVAPNQLGAAGELLVNTDAVDPAYHCDVSCVDWYGNTRPIFTDGRIFALMGTELVEGAIASGRVQETRRLNLSRPPARR
jgi:hypothetical protein